VAKMLERGARLARRDEREYREYLSEEQRRQAGCPARQIGQLSRTRDTRVDSISVYHDAAKEHEEHDAFSKRIFVFSRFCFVGFVMKTATLMRKTL
jgi:hypothetical protein